MKYRLVLWQHVTSHPTASFVKALASEPNMEVAVFYQEELDHNRVTLGWKPVDHGQATTERLPTLHFRERVADIMRQERASVHVFCGTQRYKVIGYALRHAMKRGLHFGVMAEPPVNQAEGFRAILKGAYLRTLPFRQRPIARAARFLLAITAPSDHSFQRLGWPAEKIFPFGYFSPCHTARRDRGNGWSNDQPRLVYVGQFARHKGLFVLLEALRLLKERRVPFQCFLYGDGPLRQELNTFIARSGLQNEVALRDAILHSEVGRLLSEADLYVAPGLVEPWGLTINEAIQAGLPIVVSRGVRGGSELVKTAGCGLLVPPGDAAALASALETMIRSPSERERLRIRCLSFAPRLDPEMAARHLFDVVRYAEGGLPARPVAPWSPESIGSADGRPLHCPEEPVH